MKDRLLNILIATFIGLLLLNIFLPKQETKQTPTAPHLVLSKSSTVLPNYPKVTVQNPSDAELAFNTCRDLTVLADLRTVATTEGGGAFCRDIKVGAK